MHCELCLSEHAEDVLCDNVHWTQVGLSTQDVEGEPPPVDLTGQTLGHYKLVRRLGAGGMGTVYLGEQTRIGARVAVKVLHPHLAHDESLRARFYAEARTVNVVSHPHIVHIFDISEAPGGIHYFVMEYLEGVPLSRLHRPVAPAQLVPLLAQACDALHAAHRCGVVHRDLKPDNLFVVRHAAEPPTLRVLDFGVAKARRPPTEDETAAGIVLGTPAYMAPEQWAGQPVDGRADIYALAVTAYYMFTGQLPFERGQMAELALSLGPVGPVPPHVLAPAVTPALSDVLLRALSRRCDDRYPTARDFKEALLAALAPPQAAHSVDEPPRGSTPVPSHTSSPSPSLSLAEAETPAEPVSVTPPLTWTARVRRRAGTSDVEVRCTELSKGGLFMCCAEPFPRLFTRLEFTLLLAGEEVECVGEVVRHVDSVQARAWSMSPGVGVQFINPSARLRDLIHRVQPHRRGTPAPPAPPSEAHL
ncbi:serine/threonine protein kinase [Pyxidicoccus fallax]|uniref:Protein kinase n=1 Tax=Pyxidicoccus fallax TaxID=394095 RepID=A0A848LCS5_9BACT|nr:serine/threonine-protein kinase [Pyxidicoccus fallax]NMO16032.1 protein kinase [Pyxidicoccus fallax]NPC76955.1 serine/threonine protein kinase [Pyxidicoccus fallax]